MLDLFKQSLANQYDAALTMLRRCVEACPPEHWESKIAQGTFRWVAYHTLFFTDLYLSPSNESFMLRDFHERGGDERQPVAAPGLNKDETLAYIPLCRQKAIDSIASETEESLADKKSKQSVSNR
jgi:hypothetical protein